MSIGDGDKVLLVIPDRDSPSPLRSSDEAKMKKRNRNRAYQPQPRDLLFAPRDCDQSIQNASVPTTTS
ncbi:unnamed protein product [Linum trigynum]|uniref:Uncharacterized protein n=1 Tax=Linum trigynum TaxID=586398 RepID=A0AAV2E4M0_9ROSI